MMKRTEFQRWADAATRADLSHARQQIEEAIPQGSIVHRLLRAWMAHVFEEISAANREWPITEANRDANNLAAGAQLLFERLSEPDFGLIDAIQRREEEKR